MTERRTTEGFGLIIIGSEILDGRFEDAHFIATQRILADRDLALVYSIILPDDPGVLEEQITWAMGQSCPFFCCGGIGSTPDDCTRQCAASAAGIGLELHPEGVKILEARIKRGLTPEILRMVEFPVGSELIPNPVNQIPGFSLKNGYFLPGFPSMAAPMMEWAIDTFYVRGEKKVHSKVILPGAREADLVILMERFIASHPNVSFSSLPRFVPGGTEVELGLSGEPDAVEEGIKDLRDRLTEERIVYE